MAERLRDEFGAEVELIEGEKGVFDVVADGRLVFSKHQASRFPDELEVVAALRAW